MTRQKRLRQKLNRHEAGGHTALDHGSLAVAAGLKSEAEGKRTPGPVGCPVCRPGAKRWDRSLAGKAVTDAGAT